MTVRIVSQRMTGQYATDTNSASVTLPSPQSLREDDVEKQSTIEEKEGYESNEEIVLPKNNLIIVFIGLMLSVFLAALDQTIVGKYP